MTMKRLAEKICLKAVKLFAVIIASIPKRERKLPALPTKKKEKNPTFVFHVLWN